MMALVCAACGCFGSHGTDDPPPPPPPGCEDRDGFVEAIECVPPPDSSGVARVRVTHSPGVCCASAEERLTVSGDPTRGFGIEVGYRTCDCCEECRCAAPAETSVVELGRFAPGTAFEVEADGARCTMEIPITSTCGPMDSNETRVPRVVFTDQPLGATLVQDRGAGCGCTPRAVIDVSDDIVSVEGRLCDCCEVCDCIDSGYEASALVDAPPVGDYELGVPHGVSQLAVREPTACRPVEPTTLNVIGPRDDLSTGGPRLWWAIVTGQEWVCCAEAMGGVRQSGAGNRIDLELRSCVDFDCDCVPPGPTPFTAYHPLGELPGGDYTIRAGALELMISIPR